MQARLSLLALTLASMALAGPAFADGKSKSGVTFQTAPPLNTQGPIQETRLAPVPTCQSSCTSHRHTHTAAPAPQTDGLRLDAVTIGSMTGGVGVGVEQAFLGGGAFFGNGFSSRSSFGARSSGVFARRNAAFARKLSQHRPISGRVR